MCRHVEVQINPSMYRFVNNSYEKLEINSFKQCEIFKREDENANYVRFSNSIIEIYTGEISKDCRVFFVIFEICIAK